MKTPTTIIGEALVAAFDNRDRALQNLRNAVSTSEEDDSINRDGMIADSLRALTTADQAVHSRSMDAMAVAPPAWGTIGTREETLHHGEAPRAPGTEEAHPAESLPGDQPVSAPADPSIPDRDKIPPPPAQPTEDEARTLAEAEAGASGKLTPEQAETMKPGVTKAA